MDGPSGCNQDQRIAARHAETVGNGPRIAPLDRGALAAQVQETTNRLRGGAVGLKPLPLEAIPEIMFTMARLPRLWDGLIDVTLALQGEDAVLPWRDRKLAILRTGWLCQAPYEFGEHVAQARRGGFTVEEIEQVIAGAGHPSWSPHERAILCAAEELHETAVVSDATWHTLARAYDEAALIELLVLIGQFTATAYFQNSLRLRLERGNQGLAER